MSATLRYDLGHEAAAPLTVQRWQGVGRPYRSVRTFAVKLPAQAEEAWNLLWACFSAADDLLLKTLIRKGCATLAKNLATSLGLPHDMDTAWTDEGHKAFLTAITDAPGDLLNWSAYADWLEERESEEERLRGQVMHGWLHPTKPMKVKYGIPILAQVLDKPHLRNELEGK